VLETSANSPILAEAEVSRRMRLLSELQAALAAQGVRAVLARTHRLVLKYNSSPCPPSGLTNPKLHILSSRPGVAATDGDTYYLSWDQVFPVDDPIAAAEAIAGQRQAS